MMADMDWVQDESLSREETLRRFRELSPEPTVGPEPIKVAPLGHKGSTVLRNSIARSGFETTSGVGRIFASSLSGRTAS